jgi:hypothetical protein
MCACADSGSRCMKGASSITATYSAGGLGGHQQHSWGMRRGPMGRFHAAQPDPAIRLHMPKRFFIENLAAEGWERASKGYRIRGRAGAQRAHHSRHGAGTRRKEKSYLPPCGGAEAQGYVRRNGTLSAAWSVVVGRRQSRQHSGFIRAASCGLCSTRTAPPLTENVTGVTAAAARSNAARAAGRSGAGTSAAHRSTVLCTMSGRWGAGVPAEEPGNGWA